MLSTSFPAPRSTLIVSAASAVKRTVLAASLPVIEPASRVVAPVRFAEIAESASPVIVTDFKLSLVRITGRVIAPEAVPLASTVIDSMPLEVRVAELDAAAPFNLTVCASAVPTVVVAEA